MHGFDWNEGNKEKSWEKHRVSVKECEEAFFNHPIIIYKDIRHSFDEERYVVLGRTNVGRKLHIAFTIRDKKIRRTTFKIRRNKSQFSKKV